MTATDLIAKSLTASRGMLLAMLETMAGPALVYRPAGGRGNHALWLLGHIASGEAMLAKRGGVEVNVPPPAGVEKFAMGSIPVADAAAYPTKQQLLDYAAAVRKQVLAGLAILEAADLDKPVAAGRPEFLKTVGQCWQIIMLHENQHVGQLSVVRKELAMPPVLG